MIWLTSLSLAPVTPKYVKTNEGVHAKIWYDSMIAHGCASKKYSYIKQGWCMEQTKSLDIFCFLFCEFSFATTNYNRLLHIVSCGWCMHHGTAIIRAQWKTFAWNISGIHGTYSSRTRVVELKSVVHNALLVWRELRDCNATHQNVETVFWPWFLHILCSGME